MQITKTCFQLFVWCGFSINGDFRVENLQEESLMAQRTVYDAIDDAGGIISVNISKSMLPYIRG